MSCCESCQHKQRGGLTPSKCAPAESQIAASSSSSTSAEASPRDFAIAAVRPATEDEGAVLPKLKGQQNHVDQLPHENILVMLAVCYVQREPPCMRITIVPPEDNERILCKSIAAKLYPLGRQPTLSSQLCLGGASAGDHLYGCCMVGNQGRIACC